MTDYVRKLATVEIIDDIFEIPGADYIQGARIQGWECVIVRDSHKIGDKIAYCSIDSFLPVKPEYEFLRKGCFRSHSEMGEGFRIKTIRLRKQISQGLVLPLPAEYADAEVGTDLTEALGIRKWEQPLAKCLAGLARGNFPSFIKKTDQERCLEANTIIDTEDGPKTIKEMVDTKYSGRVHSFNEMAGINSSKVVDWSEMPPTPNEWLKITTRSGKTLIVTKNHKVYVQKIGSYREARYLKVGDTLRISR